jgi:hypothetical protein
MRKGRTAFAVIGVNDQEAQAAVDGALTFGLLWLDVCREREASNAVVAGLKLFLPPERSVVVRSRLAHLNHARATFQVFELEELDERPREFDSQDAGNIATRLVRCPDRDTALARFATSIARIRRSVPGCEVIVHDATEIAFRLQGLEFARARLTLGRGTFGQQQEITFATGRFETRLTPDTEQQFEQLMARLCTSRRPDSRDRDALWRMQPERWLESLIVRDVSTLDDRLDSTYVYSQVPAFAATDRAMIDVLTSTHSGQLAVIELKADEDIHLPLQGLDYWARVQWHHERAEFSEFGYFPGKLLSTAAPWLVLAAPALRVHPATDSLLRYLNPQIEWTLVGLDENWRSGVKVVFRKRSSLAQQS